MDLSIVIPVYNEAPSLPELVGEIETVCESENLKFEILIIDDGSTDGTFKWVLEQNQSKKYLKAHRFRLNCGKAAALNAGFKFARGKYVITMDGDLQDNPSEIPGLIALLKGGHDLVSGWKKKRYDPLSKTLPSKMFNAVTRKLSGLKIHDFNCGLKAYKNEVVKTLKIYGELHRYIPVLAHWNGYSVTEKVVEHRRRQHGRSKYGLSRLSNGMFDLLTLIFLHRYISRPLHLFGFVGLLFSTLGGVILAYFAATWLLTGALHIRPLMLGGIACILLGFQIISLGLLAELIAQKSEIDLPIAESTPESNSS